jgi:hypothetical protein
MSSTGLVRVFHEKVSIFADFKEWPGLGGPENLDKEKPHRFRRRVGSKRRDRTAPENAAELGAVIAGTDVQALLCGHFHLQFTGSLNGVPVWVTPGIVTRADLTSPASVLRVVKGAGASVVELGGPYSPMFHTLRARDPEAGAVVYRLNLETGENVSADEEADAVVPLR